MRKYMLALFITILIALFAWNMGGSADEPKITYNGTGEESESDQVATPQDIDGIMPEEDNAIEADADIIMEDKAGETDVSGQTQEQEKVVDNTQANTERFYQAAEEEFGLSPEETQRWFDIVMEDDIFDGGSREISNLIFDDIDSNGKTDMIIMVQETEMKYLYGTGALYFYMNEEEPYCFTDVEFPFFGDMNICHADLNGDGNVEIAFALQGTDPGGTGDWNKAIQASNIYEGDRQKAYLAEAPKGVGSNSRGYCDLQIVMWEGRNALQVMEYLYGEGGVVHCVGWAYFILVWDEQGNGNVADWWVKGELYD